MGDLDDVRAELTQCVRGNAHRWRGCSWWHLPSFLHSPQAHDCLPSLEYESGIFCTNTSWGVSTALFVLLGRLEVLPWHLPPRRAVLPFGFSEPFWLFTVVNGRTLRVWCHLPFPPCEWITVHPPRILGPEAVATTAPQSPSSFAYLLSFISELIIVLARMSILIKAYTIFFLPKDLYQHSNSQRRWTPHVSRSTAIMPIYIDFMYSSVQGTFTPITVDYTYDNQPHEESL